MHKLSVTTALSFVFLLADVGSGINYRLGKAFHFTGNLQYKIAPLKDSIGSVTAFTGLTLNAGIGFNFSIKREKHD